MFKIKEWIRDRDAYGEQIQLKYQGKTHFTSVYGGFMTLVSYCIITAFLYDKFAGLFRQDAERRRLAASTNVVTSPNNYTVNQEEIEIAFKIDSRFKNEDLLKYFRPTFGQQGYQWVEGGWNVADVWEQGVKCEETRFRITGEEQEVLNLKDSWCPPFTRNYDISGQWSSASPSYFYGEIAAC